ncbi:esterase [Mycobacterium sp. NPDC051804]|uniref:esterase n=1 Tax=Mycobacterium sp. NPDC051804 TaxID=3364295 RepID=UPI0037BC1A8A
METVEYAQGRFADVYGDPAQRAVLMWHGAQVDARATMGPLAERVARQAAGVVVADWNSRASDRGHADLMGSLEFVRTRWTAPIVLVGWSLGGAAAAGATIHATKFGLELAHTVCLAGAFTVADSVSGQTLPTDLSEFGEGSPFTLLHGVQDDVIPVEASRDFAAILRRNGWIVELAELPTDHAAIAGADYDELSDRYRPATEPRALLTVDSVAEKISNIVRGL